jgi:hypothetical protein
MSEVIRLTCPLCVSNVFFADAISKLRTSAAIVAMNPTLNRTASTGVHHSGWRRGRRLAARGARAAGSARDRVAQ